MLSGPHWPQPLSHPQCHFFPSFHFILFLSLFIQAVRVAVGKKFSKSLSAFPVYQGDPHQCPIIGVSFFFCELTRNTYNIHSSTNILMLMNILFIMYSLSFLYHLLQLVSEPSPESSLTSKFLSLFSTRQYMLFL